MTKLSDVLKEIEVEDDTEFKITLKHLLKKHVEKGGEVEEKIKGADGKACWDGYRYAGTEKGKDKCVKVDEALRLEIWEHSEPVMFYEAEYQGRKVKIGKPQRTGKDESGKFKVYVKDPKTGNVKVVRFGHQGKGNEKTMTIKKNNPERRKSFRARHNCDNPGPKTKARYWSCRAW